MTRAEQLFRLSVRTEEIIRDEMRLAHGDRADSAFSYDAIWTDHRDRMRAILNLMRSDAPSEWCEDELERLEENSSHGNRDL